MKTIAILIATIIINGCAIVKESKQCTSILNAENEEFITEIAFNLGIENSEVTQEQFNERYINQ